MILMEILSLPDGNFESWRNHQTSNPTNFNSNKFNPHFYDFANTLSLDAIYDTNLGAIVGMSIR